MDTSKQSHISAVMHQGLGAEVLAVTELSGSVMNQSFRVESTVGTVLVKTTSLRVWINETTALKALAEVPEKVPTAALVASGLEPAPAWLVLDWCEGTAAQNDTVRRQAGKAVRNLHRQHADHFGSAHAPSDSWHQVLTEELASDLEVVQSSGLLSGDRCSAIARAIAEIPPYGEPPCRLHGDLKDVHFHAQGDRLVALLDWGDTSAGDPLYDLARYSLEGDGPFRTFLAGHGPVKLIDEAIRGYRLRFTLGCLATEIRTDGDWFETYLARIASDL